MIDLSDFVEGHIVGVTVDHKTKLVELQLRTTAGSSFLMKLDQVDRFVVNGLTQQNIIDRITIWKKIRVDTACRQVLSYLISGREDPVYAQQFSAIIEKEVQLIELGEKTFIEIEPVCGADVVALVGSVSFERYSPQSAC